MAGQTREITMDNKITCIYHGNCADGFGAAWVVHNALGSTHDITFHAANYGEAPPDVTDTEVIIVDFSYPLDVMREMVAQCTSFTILDHHVTAREAIETLTAENPKAGGNFDLNRSGAMLAWDWFATDRKVPQLLKHIQDRDLWKFDLVRTKNVMAALHSYDFDFDVWDHLMTTDVNDLASQGVHIRRQHDRHAMTLAQGAARISIHGHSVLAVNAPPFCSSDVGHILCQGEPFGATYHDVGEVRTWSLRSSHCGVDVSEIAKHRGGGGHKHAAGFTTENNNG